jgi:hypothetical protein
VIATEVKTYGTRLAIGTREDSMTAIALPDTYRARHEGITLGLIVATTTWVWIAIVDLIAGDPFHTFTVLGGIAAFTIIHYLLNIVYGVALVAAIRGTRREPTLMMAVIFGFIMVECAFAFLTILFSNLGLGDLAWVRLFTGSLLGAAVACAILARHHPLLEQIRRAK